MANKQANNGFVDFMGFVLDKKKGVDWNLHITENMGENF